MLSVEVKKMVTEYNQQQEGTIVKTGSPKWEDDGRFMVDGRVYVLTLVGTELKTVGIDPRMETPEIKLPEMAITGKIDHRYKGNINGMSKTTKTGKPDKRWKVNKQ